MAMTIIQGESTPLTSPRGTPGKDAARLLYDAGFIDEATAVALEAYLGERAVTAGAAAIGAAVAVAQAQIMGELLARGRVLSAERDFGVEFDEGVWGEEPDQWGFVWPEFADQTDQHAKIMEAIQSSVEDGYVLDFGQKQALRTYHVSDTIIPPTGALIRGQLGGKVFDKKGARLSLDRTWFRGMDTMSEHKSVFLTAVPGNPSCRYHLQDINVWFNRARHGNDPTGEWSFVGGDCFTLGGEDRTTIRCYGLDAKRHNFNSTCTTNTRSGIPYTYVDPAERTRRFLEVDCGGAFGGDDDATWHGAGDRGEKNGIIIRSSGHYFTGVYFAPDRPTINCCSNECDDACEGLLFIDPEGVETATAFQIKGHSDAHAPREIDVIRPYGHNVARLWDIAHFGHRKPIVLDEGDPEDPEDDTIFDQPVSPSAFDINIEGGFLSAMKYHGPRTASPRPFLISSYQNVRFGGMTLVRGDNDLGDVSTASIGIVWAKGRDVFQTAPVWTRGFHDFKFGIRVTSTAGDGERLGVCLLGTMAFDDGPLRPLTHSGGLHTFVEGVITAWRAPERAPGEAIRWRYTSNPEVMFEHVGLVVNQGNYASECRDGGVDQVWQPGLGHTYRGYQAHLRDARVGNDNASYAAIMRHSEAGSKALLLRANGGTIEHGAGVNYYASDDPTYGGGIREFTTTGGVGTTRRHTDNTGKSTFTADSGGAAVVGESAQSFPAFVARRAGSDKGMLYATPVGLHLTGIGVENVYLSAASTIVGTPTGKWRMEVATGAFLPHTDNAFPLGSGSNRPSQLFAATNVIGTCDGREKHLLDDPDIYGRALDAIGRVRIKLFQWIDARALKGDAARVHAGPIAQAVQAAFAAEGLDAGHFGLWCRDELTEVVTVEVEELAPVIETAEEPFIELVEVDGVFVQTPGVRVVAREVREEIPVVDQDGQPVLWTVGEDETGAPVLAPRTVSRPVMAVQMIPREVTRPVLDENGDPAYRLGLRADQVLYLLQAWLRRETEHLTERVTEIEAAHA